MPDPAPEITAKLEELMEESENAFDAGNGGLGHAALNEAWGLLPDPKRQWDYYAQSIPRNGATDCRNAGLLEDAFVWMERLRYAQDRPSGTDWSLDGLEATLKYEANTPDAAEYAQRTLELHGAVAFKGEDAKYLKFAQTGQRADGAPPSAPASAGGTGAIDTDEIERLSEKGSELLDDDWEGALALWQQALALVPEPKTEHGEATWLYTSIGDAYHSGERWDDAVAALQLALQCPDGTGNAYLWLRLGESQYELDQLDDAANSLLSAYMLEGEEIFEDEEPEYRQLLVDRGLIDT